MHISPATQEFYDWLDRVQREDSPWFYEPEKPSDKESIETALKRLGEARMPRAATPDGANPKGRFVEIPSLPTDRNEELRRQMQASANAILAPLDRVATDMEHKWGVGRLETLVSEEWAMKFQSAAEKLNLAIYARDLTAIRERAEIMRRGWVKLDELATEAGHEPWLDPDVWEIRTPKGRVYAIARREVDESNRRPSEPDVRFLTLTEVARVLDAWDDDGWITDMRTEFGGRVMEVSPPRQNRTIANDDAPDMGV